MAVRAIAVRPSNCDVITGNGEKIQMSNDHGQRQSGYETMGLTGICWPVRRTKRTNVSYAVICRPLRDLTVLPKSFVLLSNASWLLLLLLRAPTL